MEVTHTRAGTAAPATASRSRRVPTALVAQVSSGCRVGWKRHARCTTASASVTTAARSSVLMSASCHDTDAPGMSRSRGERRATPHHVMTGGRQLTDGSGSEVAGGTGDDDAHVVLVPAKQSADPWVLRRHELRPRGWCQEEGRRRESLSGGASRHRWRVRGSPAARRSGWSRESAGTPSGTGQRSHDSWSRSRGTDLRCQIHSRGRSHDHCTRRRVTSDLR